MLQNETMKIFLSSALFFFSLASSKSKQVVNCIDFISII